MRLITLGVLAIASINVSLAKKLRTAPNAKQQPVLAEQIQALLDLSVERRDGKLQDFKFEAVKVMPGPHTQSEEKNSDHNRPNMTVVSAPGVLGNTTTTASSHSIATVIESEDHKEQSVSRYEELSHRLSDDIDLEDVLLDALAKHAAMGAEEDSDDSSHAEPIDRLFTSESLSSCIKEGKFHKKADLVLFTQATDDMKGTGKNLSACVTAPIKALGHKGRLGLVGYRGSEFVTETLQKHDITKSIDLEENVWLLTFKQKAESYFKGKEGRQTPEGIVESLKVIVNGQGWSDKNNHFVMFPASNLDLSKIKHYNDTVVKCLTGDNTKCNGVKELGSAIKKKKIYFVIMKVNPVSGENFLEKLVEVAGISDNVVWMKDKEGGNIDKEYCKKIGKGQLMTKLHEMDCKANM